MPNNTLEQTVKNLTGHDRQLVQSYVEDSLTYEDALRQADSPNEVRLAIKLLDGMTWLDDPDEGTAPDGGSVTQPSQPKKPLRPSSSEAIPPEGERSDT
ncbi:hypothetical protein BWI17_02265 [Betaproteobacteria bacterium GR16-43]|nr:hypothetical protein BWI17_02265 [Betaproteobacteria bacterium GR16-43]